MEGLKRFLGMDKSPIKDNGEGLENPSRRNFLKSGMAIAALTAIGLTAQEAEAGADCNSSCRQKLEEEIRRQNSQIDKFADLSNLSKAECDEYGRQRHMYAAACKRLKQVDPSNELCAKCERQQKFYDETVWNVCKKYYE